MATAFSLQSESHCIVGVPCWHWWSSWCRKIDAGRWSTRGKVQESESTSPAMNCLHTWTVLISKSRRMERNTGVGYCFLNLDFQPRSTGRITLTQWDGWISPYPPPALLILIDPDANNPANAMSSQCHYIIAPTLQKHSGNVLSWLRSLIMHCPAGMLGLARLWSLLWNAYVLFIPNAWHYHSRDLAKQGVLCIACHDLPLI